MKRLEIKNNVSPNFIGNWDLENKELCKEIIDFFENNSDLHMKGTTGGGIDESVKTVSYTHLTLPTILSV